jgi:hypothetical protein
MSRTRQCASLRRPLSSFPQGPCFWPLPALRPPYAGARWYLDASALVGAVPGSSLPRRGSQGDSLANVGTYYCSLRSAAARSAGAGSAGQWVRGVRCGLTGPRPLVCGVAGGGGCRMYVLAAFFRARERGRRGDMRKRGRSSTCMPWRELRAAGGGGAEGSRTHCLAGWEVGGALASNLHWQLARRSGNWHAVPAAHGPGLPWRATELY